jgi:hypothetical protein
MFVVQSLLDLLQYLLSLELNQHDVDKMIQH